MKKNKFKINFDCEKLENKNGSGIISIEHIYLIFVSSLKKRFGMKSAPNAINVYK